LILNTDDHAQWAVGCYGNADIHTPNFDRLAAEGMRFQYAFSKPVCSPSRAMLLTGQYSHRLGIPDYIPYGNPVFATNGLPEGTPTIASELKLLGYRTAMIGKWHLGYGDKYYPEKFGFDHASGFRYIGPGIKYSNLGEAPYRLEGEDVYGLLNNSLHTDILTDAVINFMREDREQPFFIFFNTFRPHQPWGHVPDEDYEHYRDMKLKLPARTNELDETVTDEQLQTLYRSYYANISCVDRNLGRLLHEMDELKITEDTLVIFVGDNGFSVGQHGLLGKGNARWMTSGGVGERRPNMFDSSVLVPLIVRWPAVVKEGAVNKLPVATVDFLPTILEAAGKKRDRVASSGGPALDGRSFLPLLKGEDPQNWRDAWIDSYDLQYEEPSRMRMVRTDRWKLVMYFDELGKSQRGGDAHELFDLQADPSEQRNLFLSDEHAEIRQQLLERLKAWSHEHDFYQTEF
jgi:uncharacterized sulfatase